MQVNIQLRDSHFEAFNSDFEFGIKWVLDEDVLVENTTISSTLASDVISP